MTYNCNLSHITIYIHVYTRFIIPLKHIKTSVYMYQCYSPFISKRVLEKGETFTYLNIMPGATCEVENAYPSGASDFTSS